MLLVSMGATRYPHLTPKTMNFTFIFIIFLLLALHCALLESKESRNLDFINCYEPLDYDTTGIHRKHRRAISRSNDFEFEFKARGTGHLRLKLRKDTSVFTPDAVIQSESGKPLRIDEDSLVVGSLAGNSQSRVFGVLNNGVFHGKISTGDDEYFVDPAEFHFNEPKDFHSVIYRDKDVETDGHRKTAGNILNLSGGGAKRRESKGNWKRSRRATGEESQLTCTLALYIDRLFVKLFHNKPSNAIFHATNIVRAVREIFERDFQREDLYPESSLSFQVKKLTVYNPETDEKNNTWEGIKDDYIGIDTLLESFSSKNHTGFCEAFLFTDRGFKGGVLGMAWKGRAGKERGGICDAQKDGGKSLNTGVVTLRLMGKAIPLKISEITFAHQLGHAFGAQHDPDTNGCAPGGTNGNYVMYDKAISGHLYNNYRFSNCSLGSIKANVDEKLSDPTKSWCFVRDKPPLCGNRIVERGEQCDCGDVATCEELCCTPAGEPSACTLRPNLDCSPSQGPCCAADCTYKLGHICENETECAGTGRCSGHSFACPIPASKPDHVTECDSHLRVCKGGKCDVSMCKKYGLEACECSEKSELCDLCCQELNKPESCKSSKNILQIPKRLKDVKQLPGTPCDSMQGYCDQFHVCRRIDLNVPYLRLASSEQPFGVAQTVKKYWWAILLGVVIAVILVVLMVKLCAVYTPSSNPLHARHKPLPSPRRSGRPLVHNPTGGAGDIEMQSTAA